MDSATLYDAIVEVCPVITVSVTDPVDRAQWSYVPTADATTQQTAAADNVIATIPAEILGTVDPAEFISRWTNAEYRKLQDRRMTDNGKLGKDWDIVTAGMIDMNKKRTQTLKASLVPDVLTQIRADEIFS